MPTVIAAFSVVGASRSTGEAGARLAGSIADDAAIIGARRHQCRFGGVKACLTGGNLGLGLGDIGCCDLAGSKAVARVFQRALQDLMLFCCTSRFAVSRDTSM